MATLFKTDRHIGVEPLRIERSEHRYHAMLMKVWNTPGLDTVDFDEVDRRVTEDRKRRGRTTSMMRALEADW